MHFPSRLTEWIPFALAILIALGCAGFCSIVVDEDNNRPMRPMVIVPTIVLPTPITTEFAPAREHDFILETPPPYIQGQFITVSNGVCNNSIEPYTMIFTLGLKRTNAQLTPPIIVVNEAQTTLSPGCVGERLEGPLPPEVTAGKWIIFASVRIVGPKANQLQILTLESPEFEVRN